MNNQLPILAVDSGIDDRVLGDFIETVEVVGGMLKPNLGDRARAARGQAAAPPTRVRKSRRFMVPPGEDTSVTYHIAPPEVRCESRSRRPRTDGRYAPSFARRFMMSIRAESGQYRPSMQCNNFPLLGPIR
jgi:hypothetical protein